MRLVFAGTPPVAVTALRALLTSQHTVEAVITRPDAPAGRGRRVEPSPVAMVAGELGIEVLKPVRPGDPSFQERLLEIAPDCCPVTAYGALLPQSVPRHPAARLGEPALLGAARLARRGAGAARDPARGRHHRRDHLPDRQGAGRRPRVRRPHRADQAHGHRRRPAGPARRERRGTPGRDPGRHRGRHRPRPAAVGGRRQPRTEADPGGRPGGLESPRPPDRPPDPRLHPGPRRLDGVRRRQDQALAGIAAAGLPRRQPRPWRAARRARRGLRGHWLAPGPPRRRAAPWQAPDARRRLGPGPAREPATHRGFS